MLSRGQPKFTMSNFKCLWLAKGLSGEQYCNWGRMSINVELPISFQLVFGDSSSFYRDLEFGTIRCDM